MIFPCSFVIWSARNSRIGWNERSERLVGVFLSETDKCSPKRAGRDGGDQTTHLDISAYVSNGFGVFDHPLLVRSYWNQAEQQTEKHKKWTHLRDQYSLKSGQVRSTQEHFVVPLRSSEFFSVFHERR